MVVVCAAERGLRNPDLVDREIPRWEQVAPSLPMLLDLRSLQDLGVERADV